MNEVSIKVRQRTEEMIQRVHKSLLKNPHIYLSSYSLASKLHVKPSCIRRIIRHMRLRNIGILPAKKGYILSKYASQSDDVHFIRLCYGRRTSDYITLEAARPDIEKRWNTIENKNNLSLLLKPLSVDLSSDSKQMKVLLTYSNSLGM